MIAGFSKRPASAPPRRSRCGWRRLLLIAGRYEAHRARRRRWQVERLPRARPAGSAEDIIALKVLPARGSSMPRGCSSGSGAGCRASPAVATHKNVARTFDIGEHAGETLPAVEFENRGESNKVACSSAKGRLAIAPAIEIVSYVLRSAGRTRCAANVVPPRSRSPTTCSIADATNGHRHHRLRLAEGGFEANPLHPPGPRPPGGYPGVHVPGAGRGGVRHRRAHRHPLLGAILYELPGRRDRLGWPFTVRRRRRAP